MMPNANTLRHLWGQIVMVVAMSVLTALLKIDWSSLGPFSVLPPAMLAVLTAFVNQAMAPPAAAPEAPPAPPASIQRAIVWIGMLGLAAAMLGLSACNSSPNPATPTTVYEIRAAYDVAFLTPAAHYRQLGLCAKGQTATLAKPCADPVLVAKLVAADNAVQVALAALTSFVKANPTLSAASYLSALQAAVAAATQIVTQYGLK